VLVTLGIVAGLIAGRAGREAPSPAPRPSPPATPADPEPLAPADGAYRFLELVAAGVPRRWDPCVPITYQLNTRGAPDSAAADLEEAFARAADATGMRFVDRGRVSLPPLDQAIGTVDLGATIGADIHVVWLSHDGSLGSSSVSGSGAMPWPWASRSPGAGTGPGAGSGG
jgi:hypothetical protein